SVQFPDHGTSANPTLPTSVFQPDDLIECQLWRYHAARSNCPGAGRPRGHHGPAISGAAASAPRITGAVRPAAGLTLRANRTSDRSAIGGAALSQSGIAGNTRMAQALARDRRSGGSSEARPITARFRSRARLSEGCNELWQSRRRQLFGQEIPVLVRRELPRECPKVRTEFGLTSPRSLDSRKFPVYFPQ